MKNAKPVKIKRVSHPDHGRGTVILELSQDVVCVNFDRMGVFAVSEVLLTITGQSK